MAGEVDPELFTELYEEMGEAVTFHVDSYYEDEAQGYQTFAMWSQPSTDYKTGSPETAYVLRVPVPKTAFQFTTGMKLTDANGVSYEVVKAEAQKIIDSRTQWWLIGVKL